MPHQTCHAGFTLAAFLGLALVAYAEARVTADHNTGGAATASFKFKSVPPPARDDAAAGAKLALVDGEADPSGADLSALTDGALPTADDDPGANFFFNAGTFGGRIRVDLGRAFEIAQVNTYSWHSGSRAPQLYKLYASDGTSTAFDAAPRRPLDPAARGWKLIATVSTIPNEGEDGGQYGVSVTDSGGSLGRYRYLLFDCYPAEISDGWGNTFYSEVDVVAKK